MRTAAVKTLGCKVNQAESEKLVRELESAGFAIAEFSAVADAYIVNSCTVTAEADHKSRRAARAALRRNPSALVVLAGCYSSEAANRTARIPREVMLVPSADKDRLAEIVAERLGLRLAPGGAAGTAADPDGDRAAPPVGPDDDSGAPRRPGARTRAMVKVQEGCDNSCAYCVVPLARGRGRSRPAREIVAEVERHVERGTAEVVLVGTNLGRYHCDGFDLCALIERVLDARVGRVRLSSIEPEDVTDPVVELMSRHERICPHLHMPLQSGSDEVLRNMGRRYDAAHYGALAARLADARPGMALTTDVIVGFPGESRTDFEATAELLEQVAPLKTHIFKFSARPRTVAAGLADQVEPEEKSARAKSLALLDHRLGERFVRPLMSKTAGVLVERVEAGTASGLAGNYVRYFFKGDAASRGTIVSVAGTRQAGRAMHGRIVTDG